MKNTDLNVGGPQGAVLGPLLFCLSVSLGDLIQRHDLTPSTLMLHKFTRPGWTSLHFHTHVPSSMLTSVLGCAMASHTEVLAPIPSPHFGSLPTSVNSNSLVLPDAQAKALGVIPDTTPDPNHLQFTLNFKLCLEVNKSSPPPPNTTGSNIIISLLDHCNDLLTDLSQSDPLAICQTTSHFCSKPSNKSPSFAA